MAKLLTRVTGRFTGFLHKLQKYSSPREVAQLESWMTEMQNILEGLEHEDTAVEEAAELLANVSKQWALAGPALKTFRTALPVCITDLKLARKEVSSAAAVLDSGFSIMKMKALPLMGEVSELYRRVWIAYFVVFTFLTLQLLFFDIRASRAVGAGGPVGTTADGQLSTGFLTRCRSCVLESVRLLFSCGECECFFWALILIFEVIFMVVFLISGGIVVAAGISFFISDTCKPIYILGNSDVLTTALTLVTKFTGSDNWLFNGYSADTLLVCRIMGEDLGSALLLTSVSCLAASYLTFLLLVETAALHERMRFIRKLEDSA